MSNNRKRARQKVLVMHRNKNRAIIRKRITEITKSLFKTRQEILKAFGSLTESAQKAAAEFSILRKCSGGEQ